MSSPLADRGLTAAPRAASWANPNDVSALRVWGYAIMEAGEPRGEFIHLRMLAKRTPEQTTRFVALVKKFGGKLVGPARPLVRTYS